MCTILDIVRLAIPHASSVNTTWRISQESAGYLALLAHIMSRNVVTFSLFLNIFFAVGIEISTK